MNSKVTMIGHHGSALAQAIGQDGIRFVAALSVNSILRSNCACTGFGAQCLRCSLASHYKVHGEVPVRATNL